MEARLPTHVEAGALIRRAAAEGGFASVLHKGEPDSGALLVVLTERGADARVYERMPDAHGHRVWTKTRIEQVDDKADFQNWLDRRVENDPDLWIIELDIVAGERFIGLTASSN